MNVMCRSFVLLGLAVTAGTWHGTALSAGDRPGATRRWEYRVLTKQQVIDLGDKDLVAGLMRLGNKGWELAAVDGAYIFKRPRNWYRQRIEDLKKQIALTEDEVQSWKERSAWAERMAKKGLISKEQAEAERQILQAVEITLGQARSELKRLLAGPPAAIEEGRAALRRKLP
jgi:hypothetical protein